MYVQICRFQNDINGSDIFTLKTEVTSFGHNTGATYLYVQTGSDIFVRTDRERHYEHFLPGATYNWERLSVYNYVAPGMRQSYYCRFSGATIDLRNYTTTEKIKNKIHVHVHILIYFSYAYITF